MANLPPLTQWIPPNPLDYVQRVLLWMEVKGYTITANEDIDCHDWFADLLEYFEDELQFLGAGHFSAAFGLPGGRVLKLGFKGERDAGKDYARWCRAHQDRIHVPRVHELASVSDSIWYMVTDEYLTYEAARDAGAVWPINPKDWWLLSSHVLEGGNEFDENYMDVAQWSDQRVALCETLRDICEYFADTTYTDLHQGNILFQVAFDEQCNAYLVPIINDPLSCPIGNDTQRNTYPAGTVHHSS